MNVVASPVFAVTPIAAVARRTQADPTAEHMPKQTVPQAQASEAKEAENRAATAQEARTEPPKNVQGPAASALAQRAEASSVFAARASSASAVADEAEKVVDAADEESAEQEVTDQMAAEQDAKEAARDTAASKRAEAAEGARAQEQTRRDADEQAVSAARTGYAAVANAMGNTGSASNVLMASL